MGSSRRVLGWTAGATALALFAVRFSHREVAPFLGDEPQFLSAARAALASRHLPLASPFVGTQGLRYWPAFVWFQMAVQTLAGPAPETAALGVCLLLTLSQVLLAASLARVRGGGAALFALLATVMAMGPSHFYWSRLAWDAPFLCACVSGSVALLVRKGPVGVARGLALGGLAGAALATHLMAFPFAFVTGGLLLWDVTARGRAGVRACTAYVLACMGVCLPYFMFLARAGIRAKPTGSLAWSQLWNYALQPVRVMTLSGIGYWFGDAWLDFMAWAHVPHLLDPALKISGILVLGVGVAGGLIWGAFQSSEPERRLARFALVFWFSHTAFGAWRHLDIVHPHYQAPSYWVVPVGLALAWSAFSRTRSFDHRWVVVALLPIVVLVVLQGGFIVLWLRYLVARQGVPTHIPISCLRTIVEDTCRTEGGTVEVHNESGMTPFAFRYLVDIEPPCAGRSVTLCPPQTCANATPLSLKVVPSGIFTGSVQLMPWDH